VENDNLKIGVEQVWRQAERIKLYPTAHNKNGWILCWNDILCNFRNWILNRKICAF